MITTKNHHTIPQPTTTYVRMQTPLEQNKKKTHFLVQCACVCMRVYLLIAYHDDCVLVRAYEVFVSSCESVCVCVFVLHLVVGTHDAHVHNVTFTFFSLV